MSHSAKVSTVRVDEAAAARFTAVVPAILAAFFGVLLIWGVGFAGPSLLHNAAHDTRHASGFPCH